MMKVVPHVSEDRGFDNNGWQQRSRSRGRSPRSLRSWIRTLCPAVALVMDYNISDWLFDDIAAGLCVGLMVVPQGLSYGTLAGLPSVFGLYGAFLPSIVYGMFGNSRQLAVGPVAVTSLLLHNGLKSMFGEENTNPNKPDNPELQAKFNTAAIQVAMMAGCAYTLVGVVGLSWIADFLSHPVISGFTTAAATVIALSQAQYLLGTKIPRADTVPEALKNIYHAISKTSGRELGFSLALITIILLCRWLGGQTYGDFRRHRETIVKCRCFSRRFYQVSPGDGGKVEEDQEKMVGEQDSLISRPSKSVKRLKERSFRNNKGEKSTSSMKNRPLTNNTSTSTTAINTTAEDIPITDLTSGPNMHHGYGRQQSEEYYEEQYNDHDHDHDNDNDHHEHEHPPQTDSFDSSFDIPRDQQVVRGNNGRSRSPAQPPRSPLSPPIDPEQQPRRRTTVNGVDDHLDVIVTAPLGGGGGGGGGGEPTVGSVSENGSNSLLSATGARTSYSVSARGTMLTAKEQEEERMINWRMQEHAAKRQKSDDILANVHHVQSKLLNSNPNDTQEGPEIRGSEGIFGEHHHQHSIQSSPGSEGLPPFRILKGLGPVIATTLAILVTAIFRLDHPSSHSLNVLQAIPSGLPQFTGTWWFPLINPSKQIPLALTICLVDLCESLSIAKAMAQKNRYQLKVRTELLGVGISNIVGALFNCYTTTGSFSRTAVANAVGAKSRLAAIVSGLVVMLVLLFLTPIFKYMPQAVQGAVVTTAALSLVDFGELIHLFKLAKREAAVWTVTCIATMCLGAEWGILIGVSTSLAVVLASSAFPRITTLGKINGSEQYQDMEHYKDATCPDGILVVKPEALLYFANVALLKKWVLKRVADASPSSSARPIGSEDPSIHMKLPPPPGATALMFDHQDQSDQHLKNMVDIYCVILDLSCVPSIDSSAQLQLADLHASLQTEGISLKFACPSRQTTLFLQRAQMDSYGVFPSVHMAVNAAVISAPHM